VQQVQATDGAFAAILEDGSVLTWGHAYHGGDSSTAQHQLKNGGSVVTWGSPRFGCDSSEAHGARSQKAPKYH